MDLFSAAALFATLALVEAQAPSQSRAAVWLSHPGTLWSLCRTCARWWTLCVGARSVIGRDPRCCCICFGITHGLAWHAFAPYPRYSDWTQARTKRASRWRCAGLAALGYAPSHPKLLATFSAAHRSIGGDRSLAQLGRWVCACPCSFVSRQCPAQRKISAHGTTIAVGRSSSLFPLKRCLGANRTRCNASALPGRDSEGRFRQL